LKRFERDEKAELRQLPNKAPFHQIRECVRKVSRDATVELDTNHYSVPWNQIGEQVRVQVEGGEVIVRSLRDGKELCRHAENKGRRQRIVRSEHLEGIVRLSRMTETKEVVKVPKLETPPAKEEGELSHSLSCYEEAVSVA